MSLLWVWDLQSYQSCFCHWRFLRTSGTNITWGSMVWAWGLATYLLRSRPLAWDLMTDVGYYMAFILHLIIVLNWGLQLKCCQNDSRPRMTLSIKMQARRGLQGSQACSHGWVMHTEVACSNPNQQRHAGATVFRFCSAGFADQQKAKEIPSPQNTVALKPLLFLFYPFFFFFCYPTS